MGTTILPISYYNSFVCKKTGFISSTLTTTYKPYVPIFPSLWYGAPNFSEFSQNTETESTYVDDKNWFIEESRIQGGYNNTSVSFGVRAYANIDNPMQLHRSNALIYSGIFNSRTGFNETNVFSIGEVNTKAVDPFYGSIQYLYTADNDLTVFQESKVNKVLVDKDAIYTAEGDPNVTATNIVLGQSVPYLGDFGISKNPESFGQFGFRRYFADVYRGKVMRLSRDGLTPISDYGMIDYVRDQSALISDTPKMIQYEKTTSTTSATTDTFVVNNSDNLEHGMGIKMNGIVTNAFIKGIAGTTITTNQDIFIPAISPPQPIDVIFFKYEKDKVIGSWDNFGKQYTLSYQQVLQPNEVEEFSFFNSDEIKNTSTLTFDDTVKGWNTFYTYRPTTLFSFKGNFFSTKNGELWKHYASNVINNRGTFYNNYNKSSLTFVINVQPSVKKVFQTINYEGDNGYEIEYFNSDFQRVDPDISIDGSITNPPTYFDSNQYQDQVVSIFSYDEGYYTNAAGYSQRAGFDRKENLYVANLVNKSDTRPEEIIFGKQISGIKGYFATVKISTDSSTNIGGLKELWSVGSRYVLSS